MSVITIGSESSLPNTRRPESSLRSTSSHIHSRSPEFSLTTSIFTWSPLLYLPIAILPIRSAVDIRLGDREVASSLEFDGSLGRSPCFDGATSIDSPSSPRRWLLLGHRTHGENQRPRSSASLPSSY